MFHGGTDLHQDPVSTAREEILREGVIFLEMFHQEKLFVLGSFVNTSTGAFYRNLVYNVLSLDLTGTTRVSFIKVRPLLYGDDNGWKVVYNRTFQRCRTSNKTSMRRLLNRVPSSPPAR